LKNKQDEREKKVLIKRTQLTESEAKDLILTRFYEVIDGQLNKYLNNEKKTLIKIFENLWDKYKISLGAIRQERDKEIRKLDEFLKTLGYMG